MTGDAGGRTDPESLDGRDRADPESLDCRAREVAVDRDDHGRLRDDSALNVVVTDAPISSDAVTMTDDGYEGPGAGAAGCLAAALAAVGDASRDAVRLHYPEPVGTAAGPWLVVTPLAGRLATVARGRGELVVSVEAGADADVVLERLDEVAAPTHEHYPVADDQLGVFVRGLTGFERADVAPDASGSGALAVTYDVATTPATSPRAVEARFGDVEGVGAVSYEPVAGVERAAPSGRLRDAAETAAVDVVGDAEYEWLAEPGVFSHLPATDKVALGAGMPGTDHLVAADCDATRALIAGVLERLAVDR